MGPTHSRTLVTQQSLAQVPVRHLLSTPLSSPDGPYSFYSSLGECRDSGGAVPSPGAPTMKLSFQWLGHIPEQDQEAMLGHCL